MTGMGKHLVFFANAEWFFLSHRLPIGLAALERGYRVTLLAPEAKGMGEIVRSHGIGFVPIELSRSGTNILIESRTFRTVRRAILQLKPDILHNVTLKAVLYGTISALSIRRKIRVVNAVSGLGSALVGDSAKAYLGLVLPRAIALATRAANADLIVQNTEDRDLFLSTKVLRLQRVHLILGSGVTSDPSLKAELPSDPTTTVLFPARLLRDKGILEFLAAAAAIRAAGGSARFVVAGDLDPENITGISERVIREAEQAGTVEWIGYRQDILAVIADAHVIVLPSYREGFPKTLVEAMAVGRAVVTTDVAGCRDAVEPGVTGLLCEARSADSLEKALLRVISDRALTEEFGRAGRQRFEKLFTLESVVAQTLAIYLGSPNPLLPTPKFQQTVTG